MCPEAVLPGLGTAQLRLFLPAPPAGGRLPLPCLQLSARPTAASLQHSPGHPNTHSKNVMSWMAALPESGTGMAACVPPTSSKTRKAAAALSEAVRSSHCCTLCRTALVTTFYSKSALTFSCSCAARVRHYTAVCISPTCFILREAAAASSEANRSSYCRVSAAQP